MSTSTDAARQEQIASAEELLFAGPQKLGVAKALFLGRFVADWVMPYPVIAADEQAELDGVLGNLRTFLDEWERIWFLDMPSHMKPLRTHGGII